MYWCWAATEVHNPTVASYPGLNPSQLFTSRDKKLCATAAKKAAGEGLSMRLTLLIQATFGCSKINVFRRWGERPNERVITVGIGWVLLASATSGFSGYIKLAYCSSTKGLQYLSGKSI